MNSDEFIRHCYLNDITKVKEGLSDMNVDPSVSDNYAIRVSSKYGHTEIVRLLLGDKRVDPSAENNEAIRLAMYYNRNNTVNLLKQAVAKYPNTRIFRELYPEHIVVGNYLRRTDYV
jgi:hypothetical protein